MARMDEDDSPTAIGQFIKWFTDLFGKLSGYFMVVYIILIFCMLLTAMTYSFVFH